MASSVAVFVAGAVVGLAGSAWLRRRPRGRPRPEPVEPSRVHAISGEILTPARVLRGEGHSALVESDVRELADELRPFLGDVARQHGADEVTLWRYSAGDESRYDIVASSREGMPPSAASWGTEAERALVEWSAREQMVGFERRDDEPTIAICPVKFSSGEMAGAIVLSTEGRFSTGRDALRDWLPRHAAHVGRLVSLFTTRNEVARQSKFTRALLRIARDLQRTHEPEKLELALCRYALEVTGADFASLVRWDASARTGRVSAATAGTPEGMAQGTVSVTSLVGTACAEASASFWEDARFVGERGGLLRDDDPGVATGSLAVLPLLRGGTAIGALVVAAERTGALRALEIRNGSVLSALSVNALEAAWELAETSRRSRTDGLTGLWNRRHFDESLDRVLNETDRFGNSCALVICDIDHFKKVNDTYGHDAGDAVLIAVARVLSDGVRAVDICARLGGEELALVLPQTSMAGAVELAERLRARVEALAVVHAGVTVQVTVSMGVATYTAGDAGRGTIFKRADEKLYLSKGGGRNRVSY